MNRSPRRWQNWSGIESATPAHWLVPADEAGLAEALPQAAAPIRVTGASHSFAPLCATEGTLVRIDALSGVLAHDDHTVTVGAGTRLRDLGEPLWALGRSLINQGDVDPQAVAGACGTSTHGTGVTLGSFSSMVEGVRLVTVDGRVIEADAEREPALYRAAQTSLGVLGVLSRVRLATRQAYHLHEQEAVAPIPELLDDLPQAIHRHRHHELFLFPKAGLGIAKTLDECEAPAPRRGLPLPVDAVLHLTSLIAHRVPSADATMQRLLLRLHRNPDRRDRAYRIFPSPRDCRFNEMEYELPLDAGPACLREVVSTLAASSIRQLFPVEYRTVAADEAWLSPFYRRPSASISVHQYFRVDPRPLFDLVEPIFWKYEGRPHWGKLHSLDARRLRALYPRWDDFAAVREALDPQGRLLTPYLRRLLLT